MVLPRDYAGQHCSLSRTLEIVGERWTLLIVRDMFFGVRRFGDFVAHLGIARGVLTERLETLHEAGVLTVARGDHGYSEYLLTDKGISLWPAVNALMEWGDEHCSPGGPHRVFRHTEDDGAVVAGSCEVCGIVVPPGELVVMPGPGYRGAQGPDIVSTALGTEHRMLEPIRR
jgi:DNA-binding HxlR family transcriptional regulator